MEKLSNDKKDEDTKSNLQTLSNVLTDIRSLTLEQLQGLITKDSMGAKRTVMRIGPRQYIDLETGTLLDMV